MKNSVKKFLLEFWVQKWWPLPDCTPVPTSRLLSHFAFAFFNEISFFNKDCEAKEKKSFGFHSNPWKYSCYACSCLPQKKERREKSWEKVLDNEEFFRFSSYLKPWKLENNVCSCSEICRREKFMLKKSLVSFDSFSFIFQFFFFLKKKANLDFMHKLFILPHFFHLLLLLLSSFFWFT